MPPALSVPGQSQPPEIWPDTFVLSLSNLLQEGLGPQTSVFLSDVEADVWPPGTVANLSLQSAKYASQRIAALCEGLRTQLPLLIGGHGGRGCSNHDGTVAHLDHRV